MAASHGTAARRALWNLPLVPVVLVACAGIGLSAGDANAGLSPGQSCAVKKLKEAAKVVGTMLKCVTPPGHLSTRVFPRAPASRRRARASPKPSSTSRPRAAASPPTMRPRSGRPSRAWRQSCRCRPIRPALRPRRASMRVVRRRRYLRAGVPQRAESECVHRCGGDRRPHLFADQVRLRCRLPEGLGVFPAKRNGHACPAGVLHRLYGLQRQRSLHAGLGGAGLLCAHTRAPDGTPCETTATSAPGRSLREGACIEASAGLRRR